jgi:iron complex outermembrane receptor protein
MFGGLTLRAHLDGNYDAGYVNANDPVYVGPGSASNV